MSTQPTGQPTLYSDRIPDLFDAWWAESFPHAPANRQSRENFIAFGRHLIADHELFRAGGEADVSY